MRRHSVATAIAGASICLSLSLHAQVDPSGEWRTWHTEHFRVHAKARLAADAVRAAREAEGAYALLSSELEAPRGTIDLVLTDDADFSNGFASVIPSNRITVHLVPPAGAISTGRYDVWLRLVITHELTHIFHLSRADGIWNVLQTVFGRAPGLFPNAYQPVWVVEGLATYYESRFTSAGRVRGSFHDQLLTAAVQGHRWPGPGDATFANQVWPAGLRPYAWGSRFFEAQSNAFGDSVIPQFIDHTSRQLVPFNVAAPLNAAGTEGLEEGWRSLYSGADRGGERGKVLVRGLRREPRPRLSPDGRLLAYRRDDGRDVEQLVVRDVSTGTEYAAHRVNTVEGIAWMGDTLYLTQLEFVSPVQIRSDVYRWKPGGVWERLTYGGRHSDVFAVPDGRLGVISLNFGLRQLQLVGDDGGTPVPFPAPDASDWGRVALSPDGASVAAARHYDGRWDIVLWPAGHPEELRPVTDDVALDADPVWSPDGRWLLFASERHGIPQIYRHRPGSGVVEQLTAEPTGAREPAVAPEGALFYSTLLADGYAIVLRREPAPVPTQGSAPDIALPLLDAPAVAVRETGYAPWAALRPHYWIPLGHGERDAGFFLGAFTSGRDAVGRTAYSALLSAAPGTGRWEAAMSIGYTRWRSWSVDFTAGQTWDYAGSVLSVNGNAVPVSFRERSAEVGLSYRWRRWRSGVGSRVGAFVEQDVLFNDGTEPLRFTPRNPTFVGAVASVRAAYAKRPALSISREGGASLSALYLRRWELTGSGWSYEVRGGVNGYLALPLPGFAHWVLAGRVTAGVTGGPTPGVYTIGGESGDVVEIVSGYTLGSGRRSFPLRGYARGTDRFTRAVVGVAELRIPIVLIGKGVSKFPLLLDRFSLSLFAETGGGWNEGERAVLTQYRDVGGEVVLDVGIGAGFPLRLRAGGAVALSDGLGSREGEARFYVAFGSAF